VRRTVFENEPFRASAEEEVHLRRILGKSLERDGRALRIVRVAGHLRMGDGRVLAIRSRKAGPASLLSWLAYGDPALAALRALGPLPDHSDEADFGSLVARVFCLETWRAVQSSGLLRAYHRQHVRSAVVRGRIDFARMARGGGDLSRTPCIVFSRLPLTPLNCLLSAAVGQIRRDPELRGAAGPTLAPLAALLAEVPPSVDRALLDDRRPLSRLEQPFSTSAALARLILRSAGLGAGHEHGSISFLIDLAGLFERTVARAFHDSHLASIVKRPVTIYRTSSQEVVLEHRVPMELDVFLPSVGGQPVVVDAKYKRSVSAANLQQMAAYCWLTGARRAVLVCPAGLLEDRRSYLLPAGQDPAATISVDVAELDLGNRTLAGWHEAARKLVATVETLTGADPGR
jgi:hypothetical protein